MSLNIQKGSILKRISAWLLDMILVCIVAVGAALLISAITNYDAKSDALEEYYLHYETKYGIEFEIDEDTYNAMSDEERANWDAAYNELVEDEDAMYYYNLVLSLTMVMLSMGILIGIAVTEFVVPLILKNGQTVGKKVFGLAVIRPNCVRLGSVSLFARAFLGKFAIETMIPVYVVLMLLFNATGIFGTLLVLAIGIIQIVMLCVTKNNCLIHDMISDSIVVDMASQQIFDSEEDLLDYKKRMSAEEAAQASYF